MISLIPKSLIKCVIRVYFVIEILFTSSKKNICIDFKQLMSNIAKNNPYLQHLQLNKLKLDREYRQMNKKKFFNYQKIILERNWSLKSFYDSSIGYVLNNILSGSKVNYVQYFIKSEPIITSVNDNFSSPSRHYYCSNVRGLDQSCHKINFLNQKKIIKSYKSTQKMNESNCSVNLNLNSDLYSDEEESLQQKIDKQKQNEETNILEKNPGRRISNRIKNPILRLKY